MEHFWCTNEPRANSTSQDSPRPRLGGSHHLPPYSILCVWPQGQHSSDILFWDSQVGIPKFSKLGLPRIWGPITLWINLWWRWSLKQSCSPLWKLSNGMSHATWTQGNCGNSWFLVVGSQTINLTPDPSFGHNLYFKYLNGWSETILDICVPRAFQWYKEYFNPMNFDPCNCPLKIRKSIGIPIPKVGAHLRAWGFIPSHSLAFLGAWNVTPGFILGSHLCKLLPWSWAEG
jgi:hypothetical protein